MKDERVQHRKLSYLTNRQTGAHWKDSGSCAVDHGAQNQAVILALEGHQHFALR